MNNVSMILLYIYYVAFVFLLGVSLGYKTRSGLSESKDMTMYLLSLSA